MIFKLLGALGMIIISAGIISRAEQDLRRNVFFVIGGVLLITYSISLRDPVFIPLQIVFISSSAYQAYKLIKK